MTRWVLEIEALVRPGSDAIWLISFLVASFVAVMATFVRHVGSVLGALLEEHDPERQRILHDVLRDLLELFRHRKRQ